MRSTDEFTADGTTRNAEFDFDFGIRGDTVEFAVDSGPTCGGTQLPAVVEAASPISTAAMAPRPIAHLRESTDSSPDGDRGIIDNVRMFGIAATQAGSFR